jgi:DNA-binding MarR family transcriptional regulator
MATDHVDAVLEAWARERPDLDAAPMGVIGRITRAARILDRELETVFRAHGLDGPSFDVLATLRRSGEPHLLSASALADATMVARSSTTSRIDRLEADGLVERVPDERDGRGVGVRLTPEGMAVIDRAVADHVANEARLLAALPAGTTRRLADDLRRLLGELELAPATERKNRPPDPRD